VADIVTPQIARFTCPQTQDFGQGAHCPQGYRTIRNRIRLLRRRTRWTQADVAVRLNMTCGDVSHFEQDKREPGLITVLA